MIPIKRKIKWDKHTALVDLGYRTNFEVFTWELKISEEKKVSYDMYWNGTFIASYDKEKHIKREIILLSYNIPTNRLIPSILLWEAGLRYIHAPFWVDSWTEPRLNSPNETLVNLSYVIDNLNAPTERKMYLIPGMPQGVLVANLPELEYKDTTSSSKEPGKGWVTSLQSQSKAGWPPPKVKSKNKSNKSDSGWVKTARGITKTYSNLISTFTFEYSDIPDDDCYFILGPENYLNPQPLAKVVKTSEE